jgi:glycosyltransferase involved in cell wall biosynthesis
MLTREPRVRLLALAAAPVFYQVPLYRAVSKRPEISLTVLYASTGGARPYDAGFGRAVTWDVDLFDGYEHRRVRRAESNEVRRGFFGLRDWDVLGLILRGQYDVLWIHSYSSLTTWLGIVAAWLKRMPILLREEQTLLRDRRPPKSWIRSIVLRTLFRRIDGLYIGSNNKAYFRHFGVTDDRLWFVPYAVENAALRAQSLALRETRAELRASFGLTESGGPVILVVSKLIPGKGLETALDAFDAVRRERRCSLLIVGEGPLRQCLEQRIEAEGIPDVAFAGFLNRGEIARAFAAADVFLHCSESETWGLVVNEALNFALPVVTTDMVGCAADLVRTGENGYVVPVGDVAATAAALSRLVRDDALRIRLGEASLGIVERWTYDVAADGIVAACEATRARTRAGSRSSRHVAEGAA